ncbi:vanadium-dependent haloperoxidase [Pelagicoccus albus]|uniref:Vanadium-dependent haloperoxidase n=1 Tax=Pelagicoccus albus TaxID=415222 RepID=A0A7X1B886_9BACT|nr:vanadium-dependent haloperoxidase [Pelagicoccus albus]MBC2607481.1 vanadium-dependent haloperoxidase [Pelagicoccus albus]
MKSRAQRSNETRVAATDLAASRPLPTHTSNGEEVTCRIDGKPSHSANFTKGLPHNYETGLALNTIDYELFVKGIDSGDPEDFAKTPLGPAARGKLEKKPICPTRTLIGCETTADDLKNIWKSDLGKNGPEVIDPPLCEGDELNPADPTKGIFKYEATKVRAWESAGAGHLFDLEGPDAQSVTMPPAPRLESPELTIEMAEVYLQALLRDTHLSNLNNIPGGDSTQAIPSCNDSHVTVEVADEILLALGSKRTGIGLFRGLTKGDLEGPYLSQFLLAGNKGINGKPNGRDRFPGTGEISYGALKVSQKVKTAKPCIDYLTTWESWFDVQNGADFRGYETYISDPDYRFITTPRDLATYVHYDALYQAYLNACLILIGNEVPFDPGIPYQRDDRYDKQQGFAHFGSPHILSLVCEVATRALKAVRFQKFNIHRRLRPEALAGRIHAQMTGKINLPEIAVLVDRLQETDLLDRVKAHNAARNPVGPHQGDSSVGDESYLLPMAYPEGSPMHPSYGAGHATVAGACVTVLKAFFDHGHSLGTTAYEADSTGEKLTALNLAVPLTVEGELNKLAANISIGRDWAGVHYYSDYKESLLMGEKIAIGILEEQKLCFPEQFHLDVPLFEGGTLRI